MLMHIKCAVKVQIAAAMNKWSIRLFISLQAVSPWIIRFMAINSSWSLFRAIRVDQSLNNIATRCWHLVAAIKQYIKVQTTAAVLRKLICWFHPIIHCSFFSFIRLQFTLSKFAFACLFVTQFHQCSVNCSIKAAAGHDGLWTKLSACFPQEE